MDSTTDPLMGPELDDEVASIGEEHEHEEAPKKGRKRKKDGAGGFRKAPQAPKRFKSPYILFSMSKMEEIKKEGGTAKVTSVSRRVAEAWRNLSAEERKKWDEVAKQDKLRYNAEKSLYTGPWQVPSKRTRKDPSAPKRPMSAFLFFSQGMRQKLKAEHPEMKNTQISCLLGERWKNASEEERRPHIEREQREREQYKKDIAEWRQKRDEEEKATRKRRQEIAEQFVKSGYFQNGYAPQWVNPQQPGAMPVPFQMVPVAAPAAGMPANYQVAVGTPVAQTFQQYPGGEVPSQQPAGTEFVNTQQEQPPPPEQYASDPNGQVQPQTEPDFQAQAYQYVQVQPQYATHQDMSVPPASNAEPQPY